MSEPKQTKQMAVSEESSEDVLGTQLQALYAAAHRPLKPSEALRRRVAEVTARHDTQAARHGAWWKMARIGWGPAAGAVMAALLVALLRLTLDRIEHGRPSGQHAPAITAAPPSERPAPAPRPAAPRPLNHHGWWIGNSHPVPPRTQEEAGPPSRPLTNETKRSETGTSPSPAPSFSPPVPVADGLVDADRDPEVVTRPWMPVRLEERDEIEERVRRAVPVRDDFVRIPFPQIASTSDRQIAAAVESYKREASIVDARLAHEVTLQQKATALSDLCERLRADTGIQLGAGSSVADEKVTLFCEKQPLRDVMRQISRPFGYTWLRSGKAGEYRYELVQDLRSQLLDEELRNRDRNAALLALEREIQRYRPYLDLTPDEALARAKTASPAEKPLLEKLAGSGWGPIHTYFRLSNPQLVALRAGQELTFRQEPNPGEQPLPQDLRRGILQSFRGWQVHKDNGLALFAPPGTEFPDNLPVATVPEVQATIHLTMTQSELGQYTLDGHPELSIPGGGGQSGDIGPWASGRCPAALKPDNRVENQKLAGDPALRPGVTLQPQPSCHPGPATVSSDGSVPEPKVTSADVLEALHRASGLPIVSDYYTRLYPLSELSVRNRACFEALHQLAEKMRLRWAKDGSWLQFRSASYYDDRLKEVPNRLLARWSAARRQRGSLSLDDLVEIAQLPDAQLDGKEMAEGARECWGLTEWDLPCSNGIYGPLRTHLRYLATFTPEQRRLAMRTEGIPFTRMSLAQQQQFVAFAAFPQGEPPSLQELQGASMRVDYSQPGGFQWGNPDVYYPWWRWVVIVEYGREGRWAPRPMLRGRTREEVMQAVLRLDPTIRQNAVTAGGPRPKPEPDPTPLEAQIFPTKLSLVFLYFPTASNAGIPRIVGPGTDSWQILY